MPLQALIFDVDGTLADTERDGHRVAFNQAFAEAGLNWHWDESLYGDLLSVAGGKERIQHYLRRYHPQVEQPGGAAIAALHRAKTRHYQQLMATGQIPARPGVKRLLQEARDRGLRLAIATTSAPENAIALLETALAPDAPTWFEVIAAGDIVPAKKPAPDIYQYVLEKMGLAAANCVAIEDSHHGLQAALATGLTTIVTVNDYTQGQDFSGAALVLSHLGEPEQPYTVLSGEAGTSQWVTLELLAGLLRASPPAPPPDRETPDWGGR